MPEDIHESNGVTCPDSATFKTKRGSQQVLASDYVSSLTNKGGYISQAKRDISKGY